MRLLHEACRRLTTEASQSRQQSLRPACPCRHRAVLTRSTSSRATLLFHGLSARAIASTTGWRASVLTSLCSNRGLAGDMYLNCLRTRNAVTVHASVKRRERSCHQPHLSNATALYFRSTGGGFVIALPSSRNCALIFSICSFRWFW